MDDYIFVTLTACIIIICTLITFKAAKIRLKKSPFIMAIGLLMSLSAAAFASGTLLRLFLNPLSSPLFLLMLILMLGMFFVAYLYFEALLGIKPPLRRLIPMWSLFLIFEILLIINIVPAFGNEIVVYFGFIFTFGFGAFSMIFGIIVMKMTLKIYDHIGVKFDLIAFTFPLGANIVFIVTGFILWFGIYPI